MAKQKEKPLINKKGVRINGRKKEDLREIKIKVGVLDRADGSAIIEWGRNKILAAVYGPRELHPKHLAMPDRALIRCEYRMTTFSVPERKSPAPKRREREISKLLAEALDPAVFTYLYPRSVIDVFVEVLQADGGTRCASATVATLALADAGIPMRDLVVGCAAGKIENQVVLDLDDVEDKDGQGDLPAAYLPNLKKFVLLQSDGIFTPKEYKEALDMLVPACEKVYQMQREALVSRYAKISEEVAATREEEQDEDKDEEKESKKKDDDDKKKDDSKKDEDKSKEKKKESSKDKDKADEKKKSTKKKSKDDSKKEEEDDDKKSSKKKEK
jgi:exosome complex component RRP41